MTQETRLLGQTRDTGFQIGVRRTLPLDLAAAWRLLTSPEGVLLWLGAIEGELEPGVTYRLADGTSGEVTVFAPNSHLRLTRHVAGAERHSTIQVRVLPQSDRTTIAFHEENLPSAREREVRRAWFTAALDMLRTNS